MSAAAAAPAVDLPLGLVEAMPMSAYLADPGVSQSMLGAMLDSPAHCYGLYFDPNRPRDPDSTPAQSLGQLTHCAMLEPHAFDTRFIVLPDDAPKRPSSAQWNAKKPSESSVEAMEWWTKFGELAAGRTVISPAQQSLAIAQRTAILQVGKLRELLTGKTSVEVSMFWTDKATRRRCRGRPDLLHWHDVRTVSVLDVKSISDLTPDAVSRAIATYGYHRQQAHYTNGLLRCGLAVREFVFGFVSSTWPFLAAAFTLDDESLEQAREDLEGAMQQFDYCSRNNTWPAFGDGLQLVSLPKWALRRNGDVEVAYAD